MQYSNAMRGDGQPATLPIPARQQRASLAQVTALLAPQQLAIPDTVLTLLAPRPYGYGGSVELFGSRTRPVFDELGAARTLSQMIVDVVLQPERAARLVQYAAHDANALSLGETIDTLVAATWRRPVPAGPKLAALQRVTQRSVADALLDLSADKNAAPEVRAMATYKLTTLRPLAARKARATRDDTARAHWEQIERDLGRWLEDGVMPERAEAMVAPPGDPFGEDGVW